MSKNLSHFMEGKKTYVGIVVLALGAFGAGSFITASEVSEIYDIILKLVGIGLAIYGRYAAK